MKEVFSYGYMDVVENAQFQINIISLAANAKKTWAWEKHYKALEHFVWVVECIKPVAEKTKL